MRFIPAFYRFYNTNMSLKEKIDHRDHISADTVLQ